MTSRNRQAQKQRKTKKAVHRKSASLEHLVGKVKG